MLFLHTDSGKLEGLLGEWLDGVLLEDGKQLMARISDCSAERRSRQNWIHSGRKWAHWTLTSAAAHRWPPSSRFVDFIYNIFIYLIKNIY